MRLPTTLILASLPIFAAAADEARLRELFRAAHAAAQSGEIAATDESELRGYVLYPHLRAARLKYRLARTPDAQTDEAIEVFLAENGDTAATRSVLKPWLSSLAARGEWARFLSRAPPDSGDATLECARFQARRSLYPQEDATATAVALWLTSQDLPALCDPVFSWMESRALLTPERVEQRLQLALDAGKPALVRALSKRLPPDRQRVWTDAANLLESPQIELPRQLRDGALPASNARVLSAYDRLTRKDSALALEWLEPLRVQERWSSAERDRLTAAAARGRAQDRQPDALDLFRGLPPAALDTATHEWRLRAALWAGDWAQVRAWIDELPAAQANEPRWQYWKARALDALDERKAAKKIYEQTALQREYYGFLAAERLGTAPDLRHAPLKENVKAEQALFASGAFVRARELFFCDLWVEAQAEWRDALAGVDPVVRAEAARQAAGWGWHTQAILLLSELGVWDDVRLRYPAPYDREVNAAAEEAGLDPDLIYAVLRQESLYNPRAASSAGAIGLLQLLPATAKAVARRNDRPAPDRDDLLNGPTNVLLGALYLREQQERFGDRWIFSLAGYNAGPNRIPGWLPESGSVPADVWIENIPFNETRLYVQRILGHRVIFGWRRRGEPLPILPLLADVSAPAPLAP